MPYSSVIKQLSRIHYNITNTPQEPERQKTIREKGTYNDVIAKNKAL